MYVEAKTDFKHGRTAFAKGVVYDVPEALGGYFLGVGWCNHVAELPVGKAPLKPAIADLLPNAPAERKGADLEVQDVHTDLSSPNS